MPFTVVCVTALYQYVMQIMLVILADTFSKALRNTSTLLFENNLIFVDHYVWQRFIMWKVVCRREKEETQR